MFQGRTREQIVDCCIEGLNLFQMCSLPRMHDNDSIGEEIVTIKTFKKALRCIICYDLMYEPFTVKNCLHKFCSKCIINSGKCPQCRSQIGSRRLLRSDRRVDQIIKLLVDDITKYNDAEALKREIKLRKVFDFNIFKQEIQK